jgi:putative addiction module component (TIGR02574 family)
MSPPAKTFDELSVPEQILHVQELWDRIAAHPEQVPVTEAQRAELRRRLAAHRDDPSSGRSWEDVRDALRPKR